MMLSFSRCAAFLTTLAALLPSSAASVLPAHATADGSFGPSEATARQNGFQIFNAVHSAMRQWGSSLHHNGMSLFVATVPAGVTFYHGTHTPTPPAGPEWLAFDLEHAEGFARTWNRPPPGPPPGEDNIMAQFREHDAQIRLRTPSLQDEPTTPKNESNPVFYGYLHIYKTTQPLRLLYIDGMSAGKTLMGTLDTQDLLLRGQRSEHPYDDFLRADKLCELVTSWGLQGVIRMECGFEIIKCDFADSMALVSANRRPNLPDPGLQGYQEVFQLEFIRALSQRYNGIGASRVAVDYSSMVSALFYPVNLTNPDASRPELPRLVGVADEQLRAIKSRLSDVVTGRVDGTRAVVEWQGVADMIVARYADKLRHLAGNVSHTVMQGGLNNLLNVYIDYSTYDKDLIGAIDRCTKHYISSITPNTQEDRLILAGIESVMSHICSALFNARKIVIEDTDADEDSFVTASAILRGLVDDLQWAKWKECGPCAYDEVCVVAMWPYGDKLSHYQPNCRNSAALKYDEKDHYWKDPGYPRGPGGGRHPPPRWGLPGKGPSPSGEGPDDL
ncbi:hypothetical protein B0T22DRAFT_463408 [Podospora appendiculata]|uniref:Uncharacterized protein n=1 Tax=Podospora appendiculata TaxID=314037 RepID=A0AAE0XD79_9PEZI|nr:hypothetical protein B0T22DRAFT_463408 [Podospora appendiculata]